MPSAWISKGATSLRVEEDFIIVSVYRPMPGQARAIGAWISTQCLTNSSWDIPGFRASSEALLIVIPPFEAPDLVSAPKADAANPAKPTMVRRRVAEVTLFFEDMIRSPSGQIATSIQRNFHAL